MANWAVVIGIDSYWQGAHLRGAVRDSLRMREWLLDAAGGNVPPDNLFLVLAPHPEAPPLDTALGSPPLATKANITVAIHNLIELSQGMGERLYVFFAGHGLTTRVSNRDESALLATDFTSVLTDNSIALRSLWEYFETTQFADQFFFVDACRNTPEWGEGAEFTLGSWTLPRTRQPGQEPVQQFIFYATSPKLKAVEVRQEEGKEHGAFTAALLDALKGSGRAKAWSWERNAYEVRWERLANYVTERVKRERLKVGEAEGRELIQVPQDTGSRGVAERERDVAVVSFPPNAFPRQQLEVLLEPDAAHPVADIRVLDGLGDVVAGQVGFTGECVVFNLPPRTYALRAAAPEFGEGRVSTPLELYEPLEPDKRPKISLQPLVEAAPEAAVEDAAAPEAAEPTDDGAEAPTAARSLDATVRVPVTTRDPLSMIEVKDEAGSVVELARAREEIELRPGFYEFRHVGAEKAEPAGKVALGADGDEHRIELVASQPNQPTLDLAESMGGELTDGNVIQIPGVEPIAWAQPSTLVAVGLAKALNGETGAAALGLTTVEPPADADKTRNGVALYVASDAEQLDLKLLDVRVWRAATSVPVEPNELRRVNGRLAELVFPVEPGPCWLSMFRPDEGLPLVFALTLLPDRQATVVVHITNGIRLFQYQPAAAGGADATPDKLRRVEHLERLLLSGRLDGASELALELMGTDDPFIGCLCGYVLLRLGRWDELHEVTEHVLELTPKLADAFVLRGEHAAATDGPGAKQAFAEAIGTGIPVFAEGLTRLLEGVRAHGISHPRTALVRHVFVHHMRGSMWSVFAPRRFEPGKLVITGADTGHEA